MVTDDGNRRGGKGGMDHIADMPPCASRCWASTDPRGTRSLSQTLCALRVTEIPVSVARGLNFFFFFTIPANYQVGTYFPGLVFSAVWPRKFGRNKFDLGWHTQEPREPKTMRTRNKNMSKGPAAKQRLKKKKGKSSNNKKNQPTLD